jgi:peptidoglycan/xylan/chitin deacetylase (PgdA/CDA1 family)
MILPLLGLILIFLTVWFFAPLTQRRWQVRHLACLCASSKSIILTFDDGPSLATTPALADLLARHGTHATFFVIGSRAAANPELVARLISEGHEVGNHTQAHLNAWKVSPLATLRDILAGRRTLVRLGVPHGSFRPPYGKTTLATLLALWISREKTAFWTIDTRDSWEHPRTVAEVLAMIERQGGGVVLMHDFGAAPRGSADHNHPQYVLQMTKAIIAYAAAQNLALLTFSELVSPEDVQSRDCCEK